MRSDVRSTIPAQLETISHKATQALLGRGQAAKQKNIYPERELFRDSSASGERRGSCSKNAWRARPTTARTAPRSSACREPALQPRQGHRPEPMGSSWPGSLCFLEKPDFVFCWLQTKGIAVSTGFFVSFYSISTHVM